MNKEPTNRVALDRLTIIKIDGYNNQEKFQIVKRHSIPKTISEVGIIGGLTFEDTVIHEIINRFPYQKGMRQIESIIQLIVNQIFFLQTNKDIVTKFSDIKLTNPMVITSDVYSKLDCIMPAKEYIPYII
jgi:ATP-dependent Lon protease